MKYPNQFKEGNPIYCPTVTHRICQVKFMGVDKLRIDEETPFQIYTNGCNPYHMPVIFHATQENYELLSKLYPNVTFEPPPKRKESKEIIKAMLKAGYDGVPCKTDCKQYRFVCVDVSDDPYFPFAYDNVDGEPDAFSSAIPYCHKTGKTIIDFVNGEVVLENEND